MMMLMLKSVLLMSSFFPSLFFQFSGTKVGIIFQTEIKFVKNITKLSKMAGMFNELKDIA